MHLINKENSLFVSPNRINLTSKDIHALDTGGIDLDNRRSGTVRTLQRSAEFADQFSLTTPTLTFKKKEGKSAGIRVCLRENREFCLGLILSNDVVHSPIYHTFSFCQEAGQNILVRLFFLAFCFVNL